MFIYNNYNLLVVKDLSILERVEESAARLQRPK